MLEGQTVLITGAGRGIGKAAAFAAAEAGALVIVTARRGEDAETVAQALRDAGGRAEALAMNVALYEQVDTSVRMIVDRFGGVDAVINNAGIVEPIGAICEIDADAFAQTISVNLVGAYHVVRAALPGMVARGGGTVVNLSSGAAHRPLEGWAAYCASKAGLAMLTRSIDLEHKDDGIAAIGFAPGVVDTDMQGQVRQSGINRVSQLPRSSLAPADRVGRMIAWLCGPHGRDYAGQEIDARDEAFATRFDNGAEETGGTK